MQPGYFELFTPEGKGIIAELKEGEVTFAIHAGPESSIRGTEMFNRMMDAFGDEAAVIRGVWIKGPLGEPSANIDKVRELTVQGMPLEEAVLQTWTATRARKRGFGRVVLDVKQTEKDASGAYCRIEVRIHR